MISATGHAHAGAPAARVRPEIDRDRRAIHFSVAIVLLSLVLERFGVSFGGSYLSIVGPLGLGLAGVGVLNGWLALHTTRLMAWSAMVGWILLGAAVRSMVPSVWGGSPSWTSWVQFVALNGFGVLCFAHAVDEARFFRAVNACFAAVAALGLVQFAAQFAGLQLFTFQGLVPDSLLIEGFFNTAIPIGVGNYFKSNGLFLLEPSMFSQFMALALLIEILAARRLRFMALFGAALVSSVSGTGWLMIISFILTAVLSMGARGLLLAAATAALGVLALGGLALLLPDVYAAFADRLGEFALPGTSGHLRFVTPWWMAHDVLSLDPLAWFVGLGAGVSEHLGRTLPYEYNVNPPIKLLVEYGLPCVAFYLLLLTLGRRTRVQQALLVPVLVMILLDGGNQQQAHILLPTMLVTLVAKLRPGGDGAGAA